MTETLRWGLLSTARINRAIIPALRASPRNELAAVASRDGAKAAKYAQNWQIPRSHASYEDLLADPGIDVIYNPLPNSLHAEWTIKALHAGKHVLCEKPLAITCREVDAITQAAQESGKVVAEAFMYRHHPQTHNVKALVDGGGLGDLRLVRGAFTFNLARQNDVRFDPVLGGGSIWDVGCYPISYARMILGAEPEEVFGWQMTGASGVDMLFSGQMRFPGNVYAQFDCGFCAPYRAQVEIVGSQASLTVPAPFKPGAENVIYLTREDHTESIAVKGQGLYTGEVEDMADAALLGKQPLISLADSRGNVATIVALLEATRTGKPVKVEKG
ncbi:MAG: Gfo/Idh/MocA family protein [Chloroflexota bacterium]